jgi:hypothetical protein
MAKVFTTVTGAEVRIGTFGLATNDNPAIVPAEVAAELTGLAEFRVESEVAPAAPRLSAKELKASQPQPTADKG